LSKLKPVFSKTGSTHAGNASQVSRLLSLSIWSVRHKDLSSSRLIGFGRSRGRSPHSSFKGQGTRTPYPRQVGLLRHCWCRTQSHGYRTSFRYPQGSQEGRHLEG
jgi:hypothetical protein